MSGVNEIRAAFLEHFARAGHAVVPSAPLVPRNDPTLLFVNAGMVPFKNLFTGQERRPYATATSSQKCVRAGGKHNDLDNVGYTARHHTFFEMLGNFSFGDYFKERAIELAWDLVTRGYGLDADRLLVTVYAEDDEAHSLWRRIAGLPDSRILRIASADNFWAMGDTGPCGPCSEIFFDHGPAIPGGPPGSAEQDGDRFIEIWNLVFMQYEQVDPATRVALPRPSIDTGMGLERIAAVLQGTHDNYRIDLFRALIRAVGEATGAGGDTPSHRVIADHLRAGAFLIADGVLPSNEGRGYVLRRILRRAMRHARLLGASDPVMHRLVPTLVREMGAAYPELVRAEALITETLRLEEGRFRRTLDRGLLILEDEAAALAEGGQLPGETAFTLYDTYGFPLDLTQDALRPRGIGVDTAGFDAAMARQRAAARAAWAGSGEAATETVWFALKEAHGTTEFLGYDAEAAEGVVLALVRDGAAVDRLAEGDEGWMVLNQTPFYAESGGQLADTGDASAEGLRLRVTDVQKRAGDLHAHHVRVERGELAVGQPLHLGVDAGRRVKTRANHSATHLLHEALREVLGDHVAQKGSSVGPDRLRFDFSHPKGLSEDELRRVEDLANTVVLANEAVTTRLMAVDEAVASGARALFGEKYGDEVRVVSIGTRVERDEARPYSVELCGGTHAGRTGDIGMIALTNEGGVAAGVRRLEALTGGAARHHLAAQALRLREAADALKVPPAEVPARVSALLDERRRLERELTEARRKLALGGGGGAQAPREVGGVKLIARIVEGVEPKDLRGLVEAAKAELGSGVAAFVAVSPDGKGALAVGVTPDLTGRFDAVAMVRAGAEALGGKGGGGRPEMAQAGGPDGARANEALAAVEAMLAG